MKKKTLLQSSGFVTLFASLVCIAIGLLFGFLVLLLLGGDKAYSDGFKQILLGGFYMMPSGIGKEIVTAAPLIMCGLSVAFAFKTGLFNIGAAGQYTLGAFGGLVFALLLHAPWWVCLLASTVFGAIWGAIPGIFKAYLNVNEVITKDDLLLTEPSVLAKLTADPVCARYWAQYRRITGTCAGKTPPEHTYAVRVRAKKRHINPLVQTHSGMKRQTELDEGFAAQLRAFLQDDFDRFVWASFAD